MMSDAMRTHFPAVLLLALALSSTALADEPMCGSSPELDLRLRALHERTSKLPLLRAAGSGMTVRDGAFYVQADERIAYGGNALDLEGQSLVFEPRGNGYALDRQSLRYAAPAGEPLVDFEPKSGSPWHYVARDLPFAFPVFGRTVTRVYLSAFNGIHLDPPVEEGSTQFDALDAAARPIAVLSPLMITNRKPRQLAYPRVWVDDTADRVTITWRSTAGDTFGYDVQAELHRDGRVVFSYASIRNMKWGAPVIAPGISAATARRTLTAADDAAGDVSPTFGAVGTMLDVRRAELFRVAETDLFGVRMKLGASVDLSKIAEGQTLRYGATIEDVVAVLDVTRAGWSVGTWFGSRLVPNGAAGRVSGDTIEIYGIQPPEWGGYPQSLRAFSGTTAPSRNADSVSTVVTFDAPQRRTGNDLSAVAEGGELALPIAEAFVLPVFDPYAVWERLQPAYALSDDDVDAVAMYQTFYNDIIFYAGAYATVGNPKVDGIAPASPWYGPGVRRTTGLLHMNQLTYNYNAAAETASKVILHEFGHRWLYFFSILEGGSVSRVLNPVSAHPAAYVHTPAAFPVYGEGESSVMGGAVFTQQGDGSYVAHAANMGYSWTDLYLMGLAAQQEVAPWFYLANTTLPREYWPPEGAVVTGDKREVKLSQLISIHGPRDPSAAVSQRAFKVLFVLVTEPGREPTDAEVAKLNEWRALLERNFSLATGGRGRVETTWVRPARRRGVR